MNLLAFDTSTDHLSIAVQRSAQRWQYSGPGAAQSSATLIPAMLSLLAQAGLDRSDVQAVVFGRGPGSFTGLRTACAVAQGWALGTGCTVLPVDTLLAVAEQARVEHGCQRVVATLDARMNEVYHAPYVWQDGQWHSVAPIALSAPQAVPVADGFTLVGNALTAYGTQLAPSASAGVRYPALPTARALLRLAAPLLAQGAGVSAEAALPLYVRDKVAHTSAERQALALAQAQAQARSAS